MNLYFCLLYCTGVKLGLSVMEDHRLRMFENRVLEKIFWRKWDEVTDE